MKRRTAILRAILAPADIVLMDEPFTGLDPETKQQAARMINEYTAGKLLLFSTHSQEDAALLGAEILRLDENGGLCSPGSDRSRRQRPPSYMDRLWQSFLVLLTISRTDTHGKWPHGTFSPDAQTEEPPGPPSPGPPLWLKGWGRIPLAMLVIQEIPHTLIPMWLAAMASQTVLMPTASAPRVLAIRISAGVS